MKDLNAENYKTLLKEIKEELNKWGRHLCLWIGSLNFGKVAVLSKQYTCALQSLSSFLEEIEEPILKYMWIAMNPELL